MTSSSEWIIWQLVDSGFPGGGFAHSSALEAARQMGEVEGREALKEFLRCHLLQVARGAIPFAVAGLQSVSGGSRLEQTSVGFRVLCELNRRYDVFLSNAVANRASRAQGAGFLTAARGMGVGGISDLARFFRQERSPAHWPVVFGSVCGLLEVDAQRMAHMLLFIAMRGVIAAAVRLGIVGPIEAQALQLELSPHGQALADQAIEWSVEDAAQTSPVMELLQGMHDRLYSRLFLS